MVNMTSFEVIPAQTESDCCEVIESAEFSFLPNPPSTPPQESTYDGFNMTNLQSALMSATPDLSIQEINQRLLGLVQENEELKEALKKNNVMMQEQLGTVAAWHEQVMQAKNKQQAKLEEANEKISHLQTEISELNATNDDLRSTTDSEFLNKSCTNCKVLETMSESLLVDKSSLVKDKEVLAFELSQQKGFHKQLENNISAVSGYLEHLQSNSKLLAEEKRELTAMNNDLQVQLSAMNASDSLVLSDEECGGYAVVSHPKKDASALKGALLQLHESEGKLSRLNQLVEDQSTEIALLRKRCSDQELTIDMYEKEQKAQVENNKTKFDVSQNQLEVAASLTEKYKNQCEGLQQQVDEYQAKLDKINTSYSHTIEQLKEEISNVEEVLKFEQQTNAEDKKKLQETEVKLDILATDYERVTSLLEIQSKDDKQKNKQLDSMQEQAKINLEQIDALTAKLVNIEQLLEDSEEKVQELLSELNTVKQDAETIPILKAQVEVYKIDFDTERIAKESAHSEIERLSKEVKTLQEKHDAQELASGVSGNWMMLNAAKKPSKKKPEPDAVHYSTPSNICPFCSRTFSDLRAVQKHVNGCVDTLDF